MDQSTNTYDLMPIEEANKIKEILLSAELIKPIQMEISDMVFHAASITEPFESNFQNMQQTDFIGDQDDRVFSFGLKGYPFFYLVGDWGYKYRFPGYHVCLGTPKFHEFFAQMDLSQCLKDDINIYFVKNITKLAGHGAIARLNNGLGNDRRSKLLRRDMLVEELAAQVIDYDDQRWLCFFSMPIDSLYEKTARSDILHDLLYSLIRYALTVEYVINMPIKK